NGDACAEGGPADRQSWRDAGADEAGADPAKVPVGKNARYEGNVPRCRSGRRQSSTDIGERSPAVSGYQREPAPIFVQCRLAADRAVELEPERGCDRDETVSLRYAEFL